jgi:3-isopropylmalate dehydratase
MAAACAIVGKLADVRKVASPNRSSPVKGEPQITVEEHPFSEDISSDDDLDRIMDVPEDASSDTGAPATSAGMPKFTQLKGIAAPMERANVDTDAIIPKQFLKTIKRSGLGSALFFQWRYDTETGAERPDFVLNKEPYRNAKILVVTGPNFGCGSSREHAPWAMLDFGIRCIIAPSFADIHETNLYKNGMLPITLPEEALQRVADEARAGREIEVDLPAQVIRAADGTELATFDAEPFKKHCLINGLDDIGLTTQMEGKIREFERRRTQNTPWLDGSGYLRRTGPVKIEAVPVPKTNRGEVKDDPLEW